MQRQAHQEQQWGRTSHSPFSSCTCNVTRRYYLLQVGSGLLSSERKTELTYYTGMFLEPRWAQNWDRALKFTLWSELNSLHSCSPNMLDPFLSTKQDSCSLPQLWSTRSSLLTLSGLRAMAGLASWPQPVQSSLPLLEVQWWQIELVPLF